MTSRLLLALSLTLAVTSSAFAQQRSTSSIAFDDWTMNCSSQVDKDNKPLKSCEVRSTVIVRDENANQNYPAATIIISRPLLGKALQLSVQVPLVALLSMPVVISNAQGKQIAKLGYVGCQPQLCGAAVALDESMISALRKSGDLLIVSYSNQGGQDIKINASTRGLGTALDALLREK